MPDSMKIYQGMPTVGVDQFVIAKLIEDNAEGCTYDTPILCKGVTEVGVSSNGSIETFYADNGVYASSPNKGAKEMKVTVADLPLELQSEILGADYKNGLVTETSEDDAPKYAAGYRRLRSDGSYRYVWLLKGSFLLPSENAQTRGQNINFQTAEATFVAENRIFDGADRKRIDDNDPNLPDGINAVKIASEWFKDPNCGFMTVS